METRDNLRITLGEVDLVWENPGQNRHLIGEQIKLLTNKSDLVILPETFTTGFSMRTSGLAETMDGTTVKWMLQISQTTGIAVCGSLFIAENGLVYNRFIFTTPQGKIYFYDKRHLFSVGGESKFFTPGDNRQTFNFLGWRIALYICYDIRFPVWSRNRNDTDLIIITANWPATRQNVWNILLKARAIENQVYVAGVNRTGTDGNGLSYVGESQVINAKGELMPKTSIIKSGLLTYDISRKDLDDFRMSFPVANDADKFSII